MGRGTSREREHSAIDKTPFGLCLRRERLFAFVALIGPCQELRLFELIVPIDVDVDKKLKLLTRPFGVRSSVPSGSRSPICISRSVSLRRG